MIREWEVCAYLCWQHFDNGFLKDWSSGRLAGRGTSELVALSLFLDEDGKKMCSEGRRLLT